MEFARPVAWTTNVEIQTYIIARLGLMGIDFGLSLFRNYNNVEKLKSNTGIYIYVY